MEREEGRWRGKVGGGEGMREAEREGGRWRGNERDGEGRREVEREGGRWRGKEGGEEGSWEVEREGGKVERKGRRWKKEAGKRRVVRVSLQTFLFPDLEFIGK